MLLLKKSDGGTFTSDARESLKSPCRRPGAPTAFPICCRAPAAFRWNQALTSLYARLVHKESARKRRAAVAGEEAAWLRGDRDCGFVQFKRDEELQELWDRAGDHETMFWKPGMSRPEAIE